MVFEKDKGKKSVVIPEFDQEDVDANELGSPRHHVSFEAFKDH